MGVGLAQIPFNSGSLQDGLAGSRVSRPTAFGRLPELQNLPTGAGFAAFLQLPRADQPAVLEDFSAPRARRLAATADALTGLLEEVQLRPLSPEETEDLLKGEPTPSTEPAEGEVVAYLIVPQLPANPSAPRLEVTQPSEGETALIATSEIPSEPSILSDHPVARVVSEFSFTQRSPVALAAPEPILVLRAPLPEPIDETLPQSTGTTVGLDLFFNPINTTPLDSDTAILANPTVPFLDPTETEEIVTPGIRDLLAEVGIEGAQPVPSNPLKPGDAPIIRVPLPAALSETWIPRSETPLESADQATATPRQGVEGNTQVSVRLVVGDIAEQLRALAGSLESIRVNRPSTRPLPVQVHAVVARATVSTASAEGFEPLPTGTTSPRLGTYSEPVGSVPPDVGAPRIASPAPAADLVHRGPIGAPPGSAPPTTVASVHSDPPADIRLVVDSVGSTEEQAPSTSSRPNLNASLTNSEAEPTILPIPRSEGLAKPQPAPPPESAAPESLESAVRESQGDPGSSRNQNTSVLAGATSVNRHAGPESAGNPDRGAHAPIREGATAPVSATVELRVVDSEAVSTQGRAESQATRVREARILDQVIHAARVRTQGGASEIRIRLVPENLGEVHLRVAQTQNGLTAEFRASVETTREALSRQVSQLQTILADAGLRVEQVVVRSTGSETFPDTSRQGAARDAWSRQADSSPEGPNQERGSRNPNQREHPSQEERNRARWDRYA